MSILYTPLCCVAVAFLRCITGNDRVQRIASHRGSVTCFTREPQKLSAESSMTSCYRTVAGRMHPGTLTPSASGMSPVLLSVRLTASHELSVCWGFSVGASGKETACQCRKHKRRGFDPWVGKIPCRRKWQPTAVFLPGESHGQRKLAGYSPWVLKGWTRLKRLSTQPKSVLLMLNPVPLCLPTPGAEMGEDGFTEARMAWVP